MRVLLICDDRYHPGDIPANGVAPLAKQGFEFDIIMNGNDFKPEALKNYSVVLLCKCDNISAADLNAWKTPEAQRALVDFVENGGGLLVIHSGMVSGAETAALDRLIGCRFVSHPAQCPVTVQPIKPHPVTLGVGAFTEVDEHYNVEMLSGDADMLMASYSDQPKEGDPIHNCINPGGYVRAQGKGRVCVLMPGHLLPVWLNPQFQRTLANSLRWCGEP